VLIISELESDSVSESINSSLLGFIGVFRLSCFVLVISGSDEADSEVELCFALPLISDLTGIVIVLESSETASEAGGALTVVVPELLEEVSLVMAVVEAVLAILLARLGNISCCFLVN
jgi:hypothetical protein